ncbi:uncharacterized protein LOC117266705 isoform X4 [Epinephelus lanceolatus]
MMRNNISSPAECPMMSFTFYMLMSMGPDTPSRQSAVSQCLAVGQGLPLSPEGRKAHVTLDPGRANGHYSSRRPPPSTTLRPAAGGSETHFLVLRVKVSIHPFSSTYRGPPYPISKAEPSHPTEESHCGRSFFRSGQKQDDLYLQH